MISWEEFLVIFLLVFGLFLILAGGFTAYFGSGKSRGIGAGLLVGGIVMGLIVVILTTKMVLSETVIDIALWDTIVNATMILVAALVGALAAIALFLVAIMKS